MDRYGFAGRIAVISGGTSGIGLATAQKILEDGAEVYIIGSNISKGISAVKYLKEKTGREAYFIQGNICHKQQCQNIFSSINKKIDVVITSAGKYREERLENINDISYNEIFDVNVKGMMFFIQAALTYMVNGSSIITVASDAGINGNYGCPVYCASKGAVVAFTKALALDLAPKIRVNCICPGDIDTPLLERQLQACNYSYTKEEMAEIYPLQKIGQSEEVAHVICAAASPFNSFMTGSIIAVDGGLTAK